MKHIFQEKWALLMNEDITSEQEQEQITNQEENSSGPGSGFGSGSEHETLREEDYDFP